MSAAWKLSYLSCEQQPTGILMVGDLCAQDHWKAPRWEAQSRRAGGCRPVAGSSGVCSTGQGRRHAKQTAGHDRHCKPLGRGSVSAEGSPSSWRAVIIVKHHNPRSHSAPRHCVYINVTVPESLGLDSEDYGPMARVPAPNCIANRRIELEAPSKKPRGCNPPRVRIFINVRMLSNLGPLKSNP